MCTRSGKSFLRLQSIAFLQLLRAFFIASDGDDEGGSDADVDSRLVEGGVRPSIRSKLENRINPTWTFAPRSDRHLLTQLNQPPVPLNGHLLSLSLYRMIAQILEDLSRICQWHSSKSDLRLEYQILKLHVSPNHRSLVKVNQQPR